MEIAAVDRRGWQVFARLADTEGWRVPRQELELFSAELSGCAFSLNADGEPRGFVTAVPHQRSGWIGNLIVPAEYRGRGYGRMLFRHALQVLESRGVDSLWLTASAMGRPLYERDGFEAVGRIERWSLTARGTALNDSPLGADEDPLLEGDALVWGESRQGMLTPLARGGQVFSCGGSVALLQEAGRVQVLGPWISRELCPRENRQLLMAVLGGAAAGAELVADVPESSPVRHLLAAAGFTCRGGCDLMVRGSAAGVDLSRLVALASLGSMG